MSFAFTPTSVFDGSTFDSARQYFVWRRPVRRLRHQSDQHSGQRIRVVLRKYIRPQRLMGSDRSFSVDYTGSGSTPAWDGESLTSRVLQKILSTPHPTTFSTPGLIWVCLIRHPTIWQIKLQEQAPATLLWISTILVDTTTDNTSLRKGAFLLP